jgi:serine/threonine-protein phosphatase 4 regulatory subunit 1
MSWLRIFGEPPSGLVSKPLSSSAKLSLTMTASPWKPHLLTLVNDNVPNVRVLLAKALRQTLQERECFLASAACHQEAVEQTIMTLQMDRDSDVKYFACKYPAISKISKYVMSTASSTY